MMLPPELCEDVEYPPYDVPRGTCPRCGSADVRHLIIGMPSGPAVMDSTPEWVVWVGCLHPGYGRACDQCGLVWTVYRDGELALELGETVEAKGRRLRVSKLDLVTLPRVREFLIAAARERQTVTYGSLIDALNLPHVPNGLGRLLDLLSEDCIRRDEPSLAALVVTRSTGEVGSAFDGDPGAERTHLHQYWS